jgi:hypothetical protein
MLPMGSIMAGTMMLAVIVTADINGQSLARKLPNLIVKVIASIVMLAGLWNVLWYGAQHIGELWGNMALLSGFLMLLTSIYLFKGQNVAQFLRVIKPLVLISLFFCSILYGYTIYNL